MPPSPAWVRQVRVRLAGVGVGVDAWGVAGGVFLLLAGVVGAVAGRDGSRRGTRCCCSRWCWRMALHAFPGILPVCPTGAGRRRSASPTRDASRAMRCWRLRCALLLALALEFPGNRLTLHLGGGAGGAGVPLVQRVSYLSQAALGVACAWVFRMAFAAVRAACRRWAGCCCVPARCVRAVADLAGDGAARRIRRGVRSAILLGELISRAGASFRRHAGGAGAGGPACGAGWRISRRWACWRC